MNSSSNFMPYNKFRLLHFTLKRDLEEIYANLFLKTFALSLIALFIPIYLIKEIGFSFKDVLIYLFFLFLFLAVGYPLGAYLTNKIGIRKTIMLSIPFHLAYYLLLYGLEVYKIPLIVIGASYGIAEGIFWFAYNINFSRFSDRKHRGREVNLWYVIASGIGVFGPFVGGALLSYMDFYIVFIIVIFLLILSIFPLIHLKDIHYKNEFSLKKCFNLKYFDLAPQFLIQGARHLITGIFWPLFVFYIVEEYFSLGFIFSLASVFSCIIIWVIGNKIDQFDKKIFTNISSAIHGFVSFIKIFVKTFSHVYITAILSAITYGVTEVALNAVTFDRANNSKRIEEYFVFREFILALGRIFLIILILFSGLDLIGSLKLSFILLAGMSILQKFL